MRLNSIVLPAAVLVVLGLVLGLTTGVAMAQSDKDNGAVQKPAPAAPLQTNPKKQYEPQSAGPQGMHAPTLTGGPDAFGYTFFDSASPQTGCSFPFADISLTGTNLGLTDDSFSGGSLNGGTGLLLGFIFPYYGVNQTAAFVGSNGYVTFGAGSTTLTNECPLSNGSPNNIIAGIWDDLLPNATNNVLVQAFASGACPGGRTGACWIAEWNAVPYFSGGGSVTFEIILRDNGFIEVQMAAIGQTGSSSTTGIQDSVGAVSLNYACNVANSITNNSVVTFVPPFDLSISKTGPASGLQATNATYFITATNKTNSTNVTNMTVTDVIPVGATFVSATPSPGGLCSGTTTITCTWAGVTNINSLRTVTLVMTVGACVTLNNVATASGTVSCGTGATPRTDATPADNTSTAVTACLLPNYDLATVKTGPASVTPNGAVAYNITVTNNGPGTATNVTVQDTLPNNLIFVSATPSAGGVCPPPVGQTVTCSWAGITAVAQQRTLTINATVCGTANCNATTTNTATASATSVQGAVDANPANDSGSTTAQPSAVTAGASVGGFGVGDVELAPSASPAAAAQRSPSGAGALGLLVLGLITAGALWKSRR